MDTPLEKPCPVCGGRCGAIWRLAPIDTADTGEEHWIGACAWRWWLDEAALPDLRWAQLGVPLLHSILCAGERNDFDNAESAVTWLSQEGYIPLLDAKESGLVSPALMPPSA